MAVAPLALLVALATAGDATAEAPKPRPQMRCHWNIDEDYCLSCAPGEEPPPGVCKNRSSTWSDPGCRGGFIHSDGKCEPYNNPDTNCTAPMALSDEFLSRVPKDVAVIYEGKLGLVPNQGACGWNSTTGRLVQPCPGGLTRMMLDYSTNSSFHGWPQNFEAWMARHLARLESDIETQASISWNKTAIPKDWDGIAYADLESIKPLWELEYLGRSQGPDCKPLDGDGPCTAMWGNPNATMCSGCSGPALWDWATFVKSVCAGALDPVLLASANFSAPAGATTWAGLTATQQLQLLKGSYDHYSRRFFSDTLAQLKALRPKARWGVWAYPKPALPNTSSFVEYRGFNASCAQFGPHKADANPDFPCTDLADWQRLNDELSWLWAQLDVLMPSLYAVGWPSDKPDAPCGPCSLCGSSKASRDLLGSELWTVEANNEFIRSNLAEAVRLQQSEQAQGRTLELLPFFTWHMSSNAGSCSNKKTVFMEPKDLQAHFKLVSESGADGIIIWGEGGPTRSNMPGKTGEVGRSVVESYLTSAWEPLITEYCAKGAST